MRILWLVGLIIAALIVVAPQAGVARVFKFDAETFASYFIVNGATTALNESPWALESAATATDKSYSTVTGGEFGFAYKSKMVSWRFGFEILKPPKLSEITASQDGTAVYSLVSEITGYAPKIGLEISPWSRGNQRAFLFGFFGTASMSVKNSYSGLTIAPNVDHSVEMAGTGSLSGGGVGYEVHFFDTTTFLIEAGYRMLSIEELNYTKGVTTFSSPGAGAVEPGQAVLKTDGTKRGLDYTGPYVGIGFRFWL